MIQLQAQVDAELRSARDIATHAVRAQEQAAVALREQLSEHAREIERLRDEWGRERRQDEQVRSRVLLCVGCEYRRRRHSVAASCSS
jgi:hypothetical protein